MKSLAQVGRLGALVVLGIAAAEVLIMISPFAGFFYASLRFEPLLGSLSKSPATAWLDGFFLNHAVVTTSRLLEWHRKAGVVLIVLGGAGFLLSAVQVYANKLRKRGVATGLLYRLVRHPQYLCLGVAGWGLLTLWPRFLLLGTWVTMLFLYAGLARVEERQMAGRFGADYRGFAEARGAFLPGSPVRRLFEATLGRLRPRGLRVLPCAGPFSRIRPSRVHAGQCGRPVGAGAPGRRGERLAERSGMDGASLPSRAESGAGSGSLAGGAGTAPHGRHDPAPEIRHEGDVLHAAHRRPCGRPGRAHGGGP